MSLGRQKLNNELVCCSDVLGCIIAFLQPFCTSNSSNTNITNEERRKNINGGREGTGKLENG